MLHDLGNGLSWLSCLQLFLGTAQLNVAKLNGINLVAGLGPKSPPPPLHVTSLSIDRFGPPPLKVVSATHLAELERRQGLSGWSLLLYANSLNSFSRPDSLFCHLISN